MPLEPYHLAAPHPSIGYTAYRNKCSPRIRPLRDGKGVGVAIICTGIDLRHFGLKEKVKQVWHYNLLGGLRPTYSQGATSPAPKDPDGFGSVAAGLISNKDYGIARSAGLYCYVIPNASDRDFHQGLTSALEQISETPEIDVVSISVARNSEPPRQAVERQYELLIKKIMAKRVIVMAAGSAKESEIDNRYCGYPARLNYGITAGSAWRDAEGDYRASPRSLYYEDISATSYFRPNAYAPGQEIPLELIGLKDCGSHDRTALGSSLIAAAAACGVEYLGRPLDQKKVDRIVTVLQLGLTAVARTGATKKPIGLRFLLNVAQFMDIIEGL